MDLSAPLELSECACGCGGLITRADPSPDFKYQHCNQLWLVSLDKADPDTWRAEQRILNRLFRQSPTWADSNWEFEWTDEHIGQYDQTGEGNAQAGLEAMYEQYDLFCRSWEVPNDLPVLVRA